MSRGERSRPERTSEERRRDREERERRRAVREGGTPPVPPAEDTPSEPLPPADSHEAFEPINDPLDTGQDSAAFELTGPDAVEPAAAEPEFVVAEPVEPDPVVPVEPAPVIPVQPDPVEPVPVEPDLVEPAYAESEPVGSDPVEPAEPVPVEPVLTAHDTFEPDTAAMETIPPAVAGAEEGFDVGLPPAPRRVDDRPPRSRSRRLARSSVAGAGVEGLTSSRRIGGVRLSRLVAVLALVVVVIAVVVLANSLKSPKAKPVVVVAPVVKVLIPEGKTRFQISEIAKADGLTGSYRTAAHSSDLLDPTQYGAPHGTPDLEGFLFPATYDVDKGAPVARLVAAQLEAFTENFGAEEVSRAKALHVTPYQLLTVASLIEREAQVPGDRAKIAAVIYNRLAQHIPIGIDAAIYYAVESAKGIATYTGELTESQLKIDSPYNTRTHTGLPPTPISNPGVASIQAAAHPAHVSYLYYVAAADGCGEQVFSDTQSEFETNVAAYEAAKRKNGGKPPKCKHG